MHPGEDKPKLLLTGASGYLASCLAHELSGDYQVVSIQGRRDFANRLRELSGARFSAIVHAGFAVDFSAGNGAESESVANTRRLVAFAVAQEAEHFVFLSAAGVLGVSESDRARNEEHVGTTAPGFEAYRDTRYIAGKLACEDLFPAPDVFPTTILYLTTVFGPGMRGGALGPLLGLRGLAPLAPCPPGGTSFLGLGDFLDGVRAVLARTPHERLVLSSGNMTYAQLYQAAAEILGVARRKRIMPIPPRGRQLLASLPSALTDRLGLAPAVVASSFGYKYYSALRATQTLDWRPRVTLRDALGGALSQRTRTAASVSPERVKRANRHLYDEIADQYEDLDGRRSPELVQWIEATLRRLRARAPGSALLDIGAGSGLIARCGAPIFDVRVGIDLSPKILALHRDAFDGAVAADVDRLPFADASFDVATCFAVLHHLPSWDGLVAELARVLRPGGVFYSDHDMDDAFHRRFRVPLTAYRRLRNARAKYVDASERISEQDYDLAEIHEDGIDMPTIVNAFERAGFEVTQHFHWYGLSGVTDRLFGKRHLGRGWAPLASLVAVKLP